LKRKPRRERRGAGGKKKKKGKKRKRGEEEKKKEVCTENGDGCSHIYTETYSGGRKGVAGF